MAPTGEPNRHANTMLDLETASLRPNAGIIELGADSKTLAWVRDNIPATLATSKNTPITLDQALWKLNDFVRKSIADRRKRLQEAGEKSDDCEAMVWGNGSVADNAWIRSAYYACGWPDKSNFWKQKQKAWGHFHDMCMRTIVTAARLKTGRDYKKEVPENENPHDALDDCRHQISYFVLATITRREPPLLSPETSFSEADDIPDEPIASQHSHSHPPKPRRVIATVQPLSKLVTLETSFSDANGDVEDLPVLASERSAVKQAAADLIPSSSPGFGPAPHPIVPYNQPDTLTKAYAKTEVISTLPAKHSVTKQHHLSTAVSATNDSVLSSPPTSPNTIGSSNPVVAPVETSTSSYKGLVSLSPGTLACFPDEDENGDEDEGEEYADLPPPLASAFPAVNEYHSKRVSTIVVNGQPTSPGSLFSLLKKEDEDSGPSSPTPSALQNHNAGISDVDGEMFHIIGGSPCLEIVEDGK
ncbi:uncharacterized protein PAC_12845 [Phialocephala subalpina]|uniref:3'-5' exoribonuclease Rv2179c-like domain-containing protein n=1 Tax=Phialocephala subalpina TaxID=576137 RepID=A0A1L7XD59_9HELO|nr:uncharacterized protein PAC_12845 [Phialocephala subalpina]